METTTILGLKVVEFLTLVALISGPVVAVIITLWYQARVEKRRAKERLFVTLMSHRRSIPIAPEWVQALNVIDVVYADHPKVVGKWHELFDVLNLVPYNQARMTHVSLEMMSEMAKVLGYKDLQQTDIDKFYVPEAHSGQAARNLEVQTEFLRVLKASKNMAEGNEPPQ
jgi:hypothetical protein